LPASPEVYSIGSDNKPWLRGVFQSRDVGENLLSKLTVGGKTPSDYPLYPSMARPFIDLYAENPIGTKLNRYMLTNFNGTFWIVGILADESLSKVMMEYNITLDSFAVQAHFIPAADAMWDLGDPFGQIVGTRWRDNALMGYFFLGDAVEREETGQLPTASETYRGAMIRVEGGEGVADTLYICMKRANGTYAWVQIASG